MSLEDNSLEQELEKKAIEEKRLVDKNDLVVTVEAEVADADKLKATFSTTSIRGYDPVAVDAAIKELEAAGYTIVKRDEYLRVTWEKVVDKR